MNSSRFINTHWGPIIQDLSRSFKIYLIYGDDGPLLADRISESSISYIPVSSLKKRFKILGVTVYAFHALYYSLKIRPFAVLSYTPIVGLVNRFLSRLPPFTHNVIYVSGLGSLSHAYTSENIFRRCFAKIVTRYIYSHTGYFIFENESDLNLVKDIRRGSTVPHEMIPGAGFDRSLLSLERKHSVNSIVRIGYAGRLLYSKGIQEFFDVARFAYDAQLSAHFFIAGDFDLDNPDSISRTSLTKMLTLPNITYMGSLTDMERFWQNIDIFLFLSHREGFSKALLEACAAACAVVTTNAPGCIDVVRGVGAPIVPVRDSLAAYRAVKGLVEEGTHAMLGRNLRVHVAQRFSLDSIVGRYTLLLERFL